MFSFLLKPRFLLYALAAFPLLAFATPPPIRIFQPARTTTINFGTFANKLNAISNAVIPFLIGVAVVAILWGIFTYIRSAGDTEKVAEGRKTIVYGIIGLFMMLAFWGLVITIKNSLFGS
ncbi:MAG: hypothetical protein Q7R93_01535 [bacterium]|nr:hypothetical protein [bacterium]